MSFHIIFITAGEWPARNSLLVSQVLETARALQSKGHSVSWLASIPLLSRVKRWLLNDQDLAWLKAECQATDISFHYKFSPVTLGSPWSMPVRNWWHSRLARNVPRHLIINDKEYRSTVLHARSYDAAHIGLKLRKLLNTQDNGINFLTSFDMRSFLGPETPMSHNTIGKVAYGFIKEHEFELIRDSDIAFLPINIGRRQYFEETGLSIQYAPIQGLDRETGWTVDFEARWQSPLIGYSGSIGQWNDPTLLRKIFDLLPWCRPKLACKILDEFADLDCRLYQQTELPSYYDSLLALVIPGLSKINGYYPTLKMRCNLFSTKASEALSRGVPLIVSSKLKELADFVREHECGIVINVDDGIPVLPIPDTTHSKEYWMHLTNNAVQIGERFTRTTVLEIYEKAWLAALARQKKVS